MAAAAIGLPTTFDSLFRKYAKSIPIPFLRALAKKESSMNPNSCAGAACGLLQITSVVRDSWNRSHGTSYAKSDLLNPDLNVAMGVDLLERIAKAYSLHPSPNMKPNWRNKEFVKLVLAGWNSGYSEGGGVGKVASYLETRGLPVTHDNVFSYANAAGATVHLQNDAKRRWQAGVADLYFSQPDFGQVDTGSFLVKAGIATLVGLLLARYIFK